MGKAGLHYPQHPTAPAWFGSLHYMKFILILTPPPLTGGIASGNKFGRVGAERRENVCRGAERRDKPDGLHFVTV